MAGSSPGSSVGPTPGPDVSVRVAWADDAAAVAAVQLRGWRRDHGDHLPGDLPDEADVAAAWASAMDAPGDARNRVLVALERNRVVGFAVTTPAQDPDCDPVADGELADLVVDPDERRRGHGSRLLQAAVDTLKADRFRRATTWVGSTEDEVRGFLTGAGWAADGAHRELEGGGGRLRQVRLHTDVS